MRFFLEEVGIISATTIGAGMFALPYVVLKAGWLAGIFYLIVFSAAFTVVHAIYFAALRRVKERERIVGLARKLLPRPLAAAAFVTIILGQLLTLVAYIILGGSLLEAAFPAFQGEIGVALFWLVASLPILLSIGRLAAAETLGAVVMAAIALFIFARGDIAAALGRVPVLDLGNIALPFGPVLFALAGWTAVEPVYDIERSAARFSSRRAQLALAAGTILSAVVYALFTLGILGTAPAITSDTFSGLQGWPLSLIALLGALGICAIWTSYVAIGREVEYALIDAKWRRWAAFSATLFLPLILVLAGVKSFLGVVGFVGGVLVSVNYLIIVLIGGRLLHPTGARRALLYALAAIFLLAALYEIYYFVA
jgi:amino acid permease